MTRDIVYFDSSSFSYLWDPLDDVSEHDRELLRLRLTARTWDRRPTVLIGHDFASELMGLPNAEIRKERVAFIRTLPDVRLLDRRSERIKAEFGAAGTGIEPKVWIDPTGLASVMERRSSAVPETTSAVPETTSAVPETTSAVPETTWCGSASGTGSRPSIFYQEQVPVPLARAADVTFVLDPAEADPVEEVLLGSDRTFDLDVPARRWRILVLDR